MADDCVSHIEGAGVGNVFQPTLVAAQAHSLKRDRLVVISVRNFLRALGGSLGLALRSAVFSNVPRKSLDSLLTPLPAGYQSAISRIHFAGSRSANTVKCAIGGGVKFLYGCFERGVLCLGTDYGSLSRTWSVDQGQGAY